MAQKAMPYPVANDLRKQPLRRRDETPPKEKDFSKANGLVCRRTARAASCMRMMDNTGRKQLYTDPG